MTWPPPTGSGKRGSGPRIPEGPEESVTTSMLALSRQAAFGQFPLVPLAGAGQCVPLVQGGQSRYVNLDYAASAPALLRLYASVPRGAGYAWQACTAA